MYPIDFPKALEPEMTVLTANLILSSDDKQTIISMRANSTASFAFSISIVCRWKSAHVVYMFSKKLPEKCSIWLKGTNRRIRRWCHPSLVYFVKDDLSSPRPYSIS